MAVSTQSPAPYATGASIVGLIRRFRDKGLTAPFTADVLIRAGVTESLISRTLQALQTLELIDENGMPTATLQKMRVVSEKDYKECIADWIKSVYAEVFKFVDPSKDDATSVRDAFRSYTPIGQQDRMVALFLALCAEAGIADESKKSEPKPASRKPQILRSQAITPQRNSARNAPPSPSLSSDLPPALAGLMQSLPSADVGWTKERRDRFLETFKSVLDFIVPVVKNEPSQHKEDAP